MRFFIAKNGNVIVEKMGFGGDSAKIDALIQKYLTDHPGYTVEELNEATFTAATVDPALALAVDRAAAITELLSNASPHSKFVRAVLLVALDEINLLRARDVDRTTDVAAATTLADLKTRWAARAALAARTAAQLKTAVQNQINAGSAD